jgi:hypothetical protein
MLMTSDSESRLPKPPHHDLWELPNIASVKIERVRYRTPRRHILRGEAVEFREGIEILVETDGDIPIRALSPALRVGAAELVENEQVAERRYRFFVFDEKQLREGAPISLGWVGARAKRGPTKFKYSAPQAEITR